MNLFFIILEVLASFIFTLFFLGAAALVLVII